MEATTPPPNPGDQTLVRLACLDDDAQGTPLEILWESEIDAVPPAPPTWQHVAERGFDPPQSFASYLHALRWNTVTSTNPKLFQSPYRAGIEVMAYQLEPLRKALLLPRVNLFIADDVGLGKTIEAGLILRELILRQKVRRVVVAAPPSVVAQWRDELEQRFGLSFVILDRDYVAAKRRERGFSVTPWTTHSRSIISHALLRDESYTAALHDWLGDFSRRSLLILDDLKRRWWAYQAHRPELYAKMQQCERVLVNSQVSPHLAFTFQPTNRVFAHTVNVFIVVKDSGFAVLQNDVASQPDVRSTRSNGLAGRRTPMPDPSRVTPGVCGRTAPTFWPIRPW